MVENNIQEFFLFREVVACRCRAMIFETIGPCMSHPSTCLESRNFSWKATNCFCSSHDVRVHPPKRVYQWESEGRRVRGLESWTVVSSLWLYSLDIYCRSAITCLGPILDHVTPMDRPTITDLHDAPHLDIISPNFNVSCWLIIYPPICPKKKLFIHRPNTESDWFIFPPQLRDTVDEENIIGEKSRWFPAINYI